MKVQGLLVNVFRNPLGDCTGNGVSSKIDKFILEGCEGPFFCNEDESDLLRFRIKPSGNGNYKYVIPSEKIFEENKHRNGPMFGGNFIYTSDSRFPNQYPLPIHDRWEDWN